ncbi:13415_t:CDS:2 [Funneliformis geosporum]|nr:13415_t:CDS:2 [Funneliformis geosporum]
MELEKVDKVMKISIEEFEKVIKFKGITEEKELEEKLGQIFRFVPQMVAELKEPIVENEA